MYLYVLLALLVLLVSASYTWFTLTQTPRVSDMAIHVTNTTGIELAKTHDAPNDEWGQSIDFLDLVSKSAPLKPVSWSEKNNAFYTIIYGLDGRMAGKWQELNDAENANKDDIHGYYVMGTVYARSGEPCEVSLMDAVELNRGEDGAGTFVIGTPIWNSESVMHYNGGSGAESAIRIGIKITRVDPENGQPLGNSDFYIYEPNCDIHVDGSYGYQETPSIDGTETLGSRMILQTASEWTEAYPVERNVTIKTLGEFMTDTLLFELDIDSMVRIDLYVWLEGQDVDCTNIIEEAQILANVQFHADYSGQSGLVDIPGRVNHRNSH